MSVCVLSGFFKINIPNIPKSDVSLQAIVNCWLPHHLQTDAPYGHTCGLAV
jgi:hypothetical protein